MRILLAEDEISIARALKLMLEKNQYTVDMVHNGAEALDFIHSVPYDALVLDIMMPEMDGIELLTAVRKMGIKTPALFLTAKGEIEDRVAGLDAGADDYLPKPFATSEFLARVRALVRRSTAYVPATLRFGGVELDGNRYILRSSSGELRLNNKEYQLMELFMRNPRQVFSTTLLMDKVWELGSEAEVDVVWTYIGFLRRKLRELNADIEIKTIRGAGYTLESLQC